jgi:hypothetical protein
MIEAIFCEHQRHAASVGAYFNDLLSLSEFQDGENQVRKGRHRIHGRANAAGTEGLGRFSPIFGFKRGKHRSQALEIEKSAAVAY